MLSVLGYYQAHERLQKTQYFFLPQNNLLKFRIYILTHYICFLQINTPKVY